MNRAPFHQGTSRRTPFGQWKGAANLSTMSKRGNLGDRANEVSFANAQDDIGTFTQVRRAANNCVEDWLRICGRGRNRAENLGRGSLLLQRLAQRAVASLDIGDERGFSCARGSELGLELGDPRGGVRLP